jgi:signal transduction histidine kinase
MIARKSKTIQRQLTKIILVVCSASLLLMTAVFAVVHTFRMWKSLVSQTQTISKIVGENARASLVFESASDARVVLASLAAQRDIREAVIYDKTGAVFASYLREVTDKPKWPSAPDQGHRLADAELAMFEPIIYDDQNLGTVYIRRECTEIREQLTFYAGFGVALVLGVLGLAYYLARILQGPITKPILELARAATEVADTKNFSIRVPKQADNEIGILFDGFNGMLTELETRDRELEKYRSELESRVEARTNELKASESRYRMLFESNPLPMWVYDIDTHRFLAVNESAVNHYGYTRTDFLSMTVDDARTEEDSATHYRMNGSVIQVETIGHALIFENRPARLVSVNDITARKKAEGALSAANEKLLDASRRAGMAEVATGVLHNVGNVLNSVNVAATIIAERTQGLRVESLSRAATLISEKGGFPEFFATEQGRAVPGFLRKLADHFGTQRDFLCDEILSLTRNVEHIKQIVSMQQSYATTAGVMAPVEVSELIADALKLVTGSLARQNIEVTRDFREMMTLQTDRHRVLQILVNLLKNSAQAMRDVQTEKRITITVTGDSKRARISVSDTGCGIMEGDITRIFNHGFTTKQDGHGFGLHSGALAAKELGGTLSAESGGLGEGAKFTLEIPIDPTPEIQLPL